MNMLQNVLRPGSREFVVTLNAVLVVLFFMMLTVIYTNLEDSIHVFVLLFLILGLTVSINWFIIETNSLKHSVVSTNKQKPSRNARVKSN